jgi:hypothetical protein
VKADRPQKYKARTTFSGIYRGLEHLLSVLGCLDEAEDGMRAGVRKVTGVAATIAIVLHTILWAATAPFAAPTVDPFTVICHSDASAPIDQTPVNGAAPPGHACDHCSLCSAIAPPVPVSALSSTLAPTQVLQVLRLAAVTPHRDVAADPKLARGPPAFA